MIVKVRFSLQHTLCLFVALLAKAKLAITIVKLAMIVVL